MARRRSFFRDNGLTLALMALFAVSLVGHAATGYRENNDDRREHGRPAITFGAYLASGQFTESVAENWESEFLQMLAFVYLTVYLFQRGSPESKDPDEDEEVDEDPRTVPKRSDLPGPVKRGGFALAIYEHSLGLAFLALFAASFALHVWGGARHYNDEALEHGEPTIGALQYLGTARFWFESFQNWQSEFLSVAAMVFLSVYLRQRGSSESKPVATPHHAHE
jgi:hypothetical protein